MLENTTVDPKLFTYIKAGACDFWTINPYANCDHNCNYCITQVQGESKPVFAKEQLISLVEQALKQIPEGLPLAIGGISDAYPNSEDSFGVSRELLRVLNKHNRRYSVITKGTGIKRDIDLLLDNPSAQVVFSFSTLDERLARKYERNAPSPLDRLALLHELVAHKINTSISLKPWIPGVTNIQAFLDEVPDCVSLKLERLKIVRASRQFHIENIRFSQHEIDDLYLREKEKFAGESRLAWQFDRTYCANGTNPTHPIMQAWEKNRVENTKLFERGKLLQVSGPTLNYSKH